MRPNAKPAVTFAGRMQDRHCYPPLWRRAFVRNANAACGSRIPPSACERLPGAKRLKGFCVSRLGPPPRAPRLGARTATAPRPASRDDRDAPLKVGARYGEYSPMEDFVKASKMTIEARFRSLSKISYNQINDSMQRLISTQRINQQSDGGLVRLYKPNGRIGGKTRCSSFVNCISSATPSLCSLGAYNLVRSTDNFKN
jgi:hypothetical protein